LENPGSRNPSAVSVWKYKVLGRPGAR
jgi:hypothetical protein